MDLRGGGVPVCNMHQGEEELRGGGDRDESPFPRRGGGRDESPFPNRGRDRDESPFTKRGD